MLEKRFRAVPAQSFAANGTTTGIITVPDTSLFKVKQQVIVAASTLPNLDQLEVKDVLSPTQMMLGPRTANITTPQDLSAYTTALGANVFANEQKRPQVPSDDFERACYEEEPTVAKRVIMVDKFGNKIDNANPFPVNASVSIGDINVDLNFDPNNPDGPASSNTGAYIRDADGNLITSTVNGTKQELDVSDANTHSALSGIQTTLTSIDAGIPAALGPNTSVNSMPVTIASDQAPIPVEMTFPDEPLKISGTKDGAPSGTEFGFVNNERLQILDAHDRVAAFTYADFGTKNQRITMIDYTSATFPGVTIRRQFPYTLIGNNYRRDNEIWTVI